MNKPTLIAITITVLCVLALAGYRLRFGSKGLSTPLSMHDQEFLGTWKADAVDEAALRSFGDVILEFADDGTLRYTIHENGKDQIMLLTFRVEPGFIITDQPSHPRPERTAYEFLPDGQLVLSFGGQKLRYRRVK